MKPAALSLTLVLLVVTAFAADGPGTQDAAASSEQATEPTEIHRIDCSNNPRALWDAEPVVQHRDGDEIHQYWLLVDQPDLWSLETPKLDSLERYRDQVREALPDTSPLGMIRTNRERNTWLGEEYPNEDKINRQVEAGVGRHRAMNCLESHILAYQATRFPLYEHPTEIVALFVKRAAAPGDPSETDLVKVYIAADDDSVVPKPNPAVEAIEADVANGWRFTGVFHNHTFNHTPDRGLIPVAAPSASDVQVSVALAERLGLEGIQVTDGFSTLELTAEEVERLWGRLGARRKGSVAPPCATSSDVGDGAPKLPELP